ncbi:MAG: hypothetical protein EBS53_04180 [Bacteroidetes bacterium]|nr:hypothetical protein [Bacteroidota bacterium]
MASEIRFWTSKEGRKGFMAGLAGPWMMMGLLVAYRMQSGSMESATDNDSSAVSDWWDLLWRSGLVGPLLSLAVLPNLALFWWNLYRQSEKGAGGVLVATFIYAVVVVLIKWVF